MSDSIAVPGFSAHRLRPEAQNPREVAFWEQWSFEHQVHRGGLLAHLVPDYTERDARVAATIIQWLGSNVGMCFIEEAAERSPELLDGLLHRLRRVEARNA